MSEPTWVIGVGIGLVSIGLAMFYYLAGVQRSAAVDLARVEKEFAQYREMIAVTYVRADRLSAMQTEITGQIATLRNEVHNDAQRSADRAEAMRADLERKFAAITDQMARLSGERRTRATDV